MIYFVSTTGDDSAAGTICSPWKTIETAVNKVSAGDILYVRGGDYTLSESVQCKKNGKPGKPIIYSAYENEIPVLDAKNINFYKESDKYSFGVETGAIFLHEVEHIEIIGIHVKNSTGHGIAVRDSNNIKIDRCKTQNTFACGISLWDTNCTGTICHNNKVIGNTVVKATTWDMLPEGKKRGHEPPHEAISIAGACYFEVAYNTVYNCDKEGIDVKEVSHHGTVHHNHVYDCDRQGLYADAWFGPLTNVDFFHNTVHNCRGAGIVVAVEEGYCVSDVKIYNNTVYDNWGTGILFGIFGMDKIRYRIDIFNNIVKRNGHGNPDAHDAGDYFWITGGLCLLSAQTQYCNIYNNIFEDNKGFDIGYSSRFLESNPTIKDINTIFAKNKINIFDNLILSKGESPQYPITTNYENSTLFGL